MNKKKKLKTRIQELKKTSKGTAILKLICWGIFFFFLFLFCLIVTLFVKPLNEASNIDNSSEEKIEVVPTLSIITKKEIEKFKELFNNEYNYLYNIKVNDISYNFRGYKTLTSNTGYKESPDGVIKYYIDETGIYEENTTERIPITNLYEGLDENLLNPLIIIEKIESLKLCLNSSYDLQTHVYEAKDDLYTYLIHLNKTSLELEKIEIKNDYKDYSLSFNSKGG